MFEETRNTENRAPDLPELLLLPFSEFYKKHGNLYNGLLKIRHDRDPYDRRSDVLSRAAEAHARRYLMQDLYERNKNFRELVNSDQGWRILPHFTSDKSGLYFDDDGYLVNEPVYQWANINDDAYKDQLGRYQDALAQQVLRTTVDDDEAVKKVKKYLAAYPDYFTPRDYLRAQLQELGFDPGESDVIWGGDVLPDPRDMEGVAVPKGYKHTPYTEDASTLRNIRNAALSMLTPESATAIIDPVTRGRYPMSSHILNGAEDVAVWAIPGGAAVKGVKLAAKSPLKRIIPMGLSRAIGAALGGFAGSEVEGEAQRLIDKARLQVPENDLLGQAPGTAKDAHDYDMYSKLFTNTQEPKSHSAILGESILNGLLGAVFGGLADPVTGTVHPVNPRTVRERNAILAQIRETGPEKNSALHSSETDLEKNRALWHRLHNLAIENPDYMDYLKAVSGRDDFSNLDDFVETISPMLRRDFGNDLRAGQRAELNRANKSLEKGIYKMKNRIESGQGSKEDFYVFEAFADEFEHTGEQLLREGSDKANMYLDMANDIRELVARKMSEPSEIKLVIPEDVSGMHVVPFDLIKGFTHSRTTDAAQFPRPNHPEDMRFFTYLDPEAPPMTRFEAAPSYPQGVPKVKPLSPAEQLNLSGDDAHFAATLDEALAPLSPAEQLNAATFDKALAYADRLEEKASNAEFEAITNNTCKPPSDYLIDHPNAGARNSLVHKNDWSQQDLDEFIQNNPSLLAPGDYGAAEEILRQLKSPMSVFSRAGGYSKPSVLKSEQPGELTASRKKGVWYEPQEISHEDVSAIKKISDKFNPETDLDRGDLYRNARLEKGRDKYYNSVEKLTFKDLPSQDLRGQPIEFKNAVAPKDLRGQPVKVKNTTVPQNTEPAVLELPRGKEDRPMRYSYTIYPLGLGKGLGKDLLKGAAIGGYIYGKGKAHKGDD